MPEFFKDPKFVGALLAVAVGLVLLFATDDTALGIGLVLAGLATFGVTQAVKKSAMVFAGLTLALSGCTCPEGYVHVETFAGLVDPVAARHDAYVTADESLDEFQKRVFLRSTELLRKAIEEATQ